MLQNATITIHDQWVPNNAVPGRYDASGTMTLENGQSVEVSCQAEPNAVQTMAFASVTIPSASDTLMALDGTVSKIVIDGHNCQATATSGDSALRLRGMIPMDAFQQMTSDQPDQLPDPSSQPLPAEVPQLQRNDNEVVVDLTGRVPAGSAQDFAQAAFGEAQSVAPVAPVSATGRHLSTGLEAPLDTVEQRIEAFRTVRLNTVASGRRVKTINMRLTELQAEIEELTQERNRIETQTAQAAADIQTQGNALIEAVQAELGEAG